MRSLQYSIFACAHLEGSARGLPKRPKWSTCVESKVIGVKSSCLEGLVDYSIQAEDIIIYLCNFQSTFACFFRQFCCFLPVMMSSGDRVSQRCAQLTSEPKSVLGVHTSVPNISWTRRTTPLGLGIPWPPCWQFGTIPNHGLTWRPCHSRNPRGLGDAQKICLTHMT